MVRDICGESAMRTPKWGIRDFHLECAKRRLDVVFSVVLVAEAEGSWPSLLGSVLGWTHFPERGGERGGEPGGEDAPGKSTRHSREGGATVADDEISDPALREAMDAMHAYDMMLYEYAREKYVV